MRLLLLLVTAVSLLHCLDVWKVTITTGDRQQLNKRPKTRGIQDIRGSTLRKQLLIDASQLAPQAGGLCLVSKLH